MKVYIDTCIISGIVNEDLSELELTSIKELLEHHDKFGIHVCTSEVAKEEIDRIPDEHRIKHTSIYKQLSKVKTITYLKLKLIPRIGLPVEQTEGYSDLKGILKDKGDAKHIYQCSKNNIEIFLTVDKATILNKANEIKKICGVNALYPSDLLNQLNSLDKRAAAGVKLIVRS